MEFNESKRSEKACAICAKSFGIINKGKECQECRKMVCKEHMIAEDKNKYKCINCEIRSIQSAREKEIQSDLHKLSLEIEEAMEEYEKLDKEKQEKIKEIEEIEEQIVSDEKKMKKDEDALENELQNYIEESRKIQEKYSQVIEALEKNTKLEKEYREETVEIENKIKAIKDKIAQEKETKQYYGLEIELTSTKILAGLKIDKLGEVLCTNCKNNALGSISNGLLAEEDKK